MEHHFASIMRTQNLGKNPDSNSRIVKVKRFKQITLLYTTSPLSNKLNQTAKEGAAL